VPVEDDTAQVTSQRRRDLVLVTIIKRASVALPLALWAVAAGSFGYVCTDHAGWPLWSRFASAAVCALAAVAAPRRIKA
jgi:hypothetical protein